MAIRSLAQVLTTNQSSDVRTVVPTSTRLLNSLSSGKSGHATSVGM